MGMFDTVRVPCPNCGEREDFQSKSGSCCLRTYDLENCPADILADVNRHAPATCAHCGTVFAVELTVAARAVAVAEETPDFDA